MQYSLLRPVFNKLEKNLGDRQTAEELASSIEEAINEIAKAASKDTVDKMSIVKSEIKEDLSRTLVTKEMFQAMQEQMDHRFAAVDEKFQHLEDKMDQRLQSMQEHTD